MKAFEKWWYSHRGGALENFELDKNNNSETWKAALEWLRDNREMKAWDDVDDMIRKELED